MSTLRLRLWVKVTLTVLAVAVVGLAIVQLFTREETHSTPVGDYTCRGGIVQICSTDSQEVYDLNQ